MTIISARLTISFPRFLSPSSSPPMYLSFAQPRVTCYYNLARRKILPEQVVFALTSDHRVETSVTSVTEIYGRSYLLRALLRNVYTGRTQNKREAVARSNAFTNGGGLQARSNYCAFASRGCMTNTFGNSITPKGPAVQCDLISADYGNRSRRITAAYYAPFSGRSQAPDVRATQIAGWSWW